MDQMIPFLREGSEEKFNAASGAGRNLDAGKFIGQRTSSPTTNTERVMNTLGLPHYLLNSYSLDPKADNRFNQLFNSLIEEESSKLMEDKNFLNGTFELRNRKWKKATERARKLTKEYMASSIDDAGDPALKIILDISSSYGTTKTEKALKNLQANGSIPEGASLSELSEGQLRLLEGLLSTNDDFLSQF